MRLSIKTSGGLGNIQLQGQLDTDELEPSLAKRVISTLTPKRLESQSTSTEMGVADMIQYEIRLFLNNGVYHYILDEANTAQDVIEVLQDLIHELIRKKQANH